MRYLISTLFVLLAACEGAAPRSEVVGGTAGQPDATRSLPAPQPATSGALARGPRVVFLGTSLTAGLGLADPQERFPEVLGTLADSADRPIRVINAGVSGETSAGGLRRLDGVLRDSVDILVLELGANDGLRGQDVRALEENLRTMIQRARVRYPGVTVILLGMQAPPNLGPDYTSAFREVYPRVAASAGAALVPFLLEGVAGVPELNQSDRIHPTAEGHRRLARTVWPVLDSVLRVRGRRP